MRPSFYSIASAAVFALFALGFGTVGAYNLPVTVAGVKVGSEVIWVATGLMFVLAYFALTHLRHR